METFRKVHIKSEADLPKINKGWFSVHSKETNVNDCHSSYWLGGMYKNAWLRDYDWYLEPIILTDSDIEAWATDICYKRSIDVGGSHHSGLINGAKQMRDGEIERRNK